MSGKGVTLKAAMDRKAPDMIKSVNRFADLHRDAITKTKDGKRQFVDLVEAAGQASCVEEFKLYIQYKGSKDGTRGLWGKLAAPFNEAISELMVNVGNEAAKNICQTGAEEEKEYVRLEVLRRFCGYLMWRVHADIAERGGR